jgi:mono/diheme cytochrome c family protein
MKKRNQLSQFALASRWIASTRWIAVPLLAAPLLSACGADDGILLAEILQQAQNGNDSPDGPAEPSEPETPPAYEPPTPAETDQEAMEAMLLTYCGSCHQSDDPEQALGGFGDVGSIDAIVERGLIVPSSPRDSSLLIRIQDGSMPPAFTTERPSTEEIAELEAFIDAMPVDPLELAAIWRANAARNVLGTYCSNCHGSEVAFGDLGNITDLDALVEAGKIIPGSPADSQLYVRMQNGSMPPNSTRDKPTAEDLKLIEDYIEALD